MSEDTEAVSSIEIKWEEFRKCDDFKEAMRFVSDKELLKELLYSAMVEGYELGKQEGADDASGKGAFGS